MFTTVRYRSLGVVPRELFDPCQALVKALPIDEQTDVPPQWKWTIPAKVTYVVKDGEFVMPGYEELIAWLERLTKLKTWYGTLSWLPPGVSIPEHTDERHYHSSCVRYHIPMISPGGSVMESRFFKEAQRSKFIFEEGRLYSFNNRIPHVAENRTDSVRVHLVVDQCGDRMYDYYKGNRGLSESRYFPTPFEVSYVRAKQAGTGTAASLDSAMNLAESKS